LHTPAAEKANRGHWSELKTNWRRDSERTAKIEAGNPMGEHDVEVGADTETRPEDNGEQDKVRECLWSCNPLKSIATCIQKLASRIRPTQKTFTASLPT